MERYRKLLYALNVENMFYYEDLDGTTKQTDKKIDLKGFSDKEYLLIYGERLQFDKLSVKIELVSDNEIAFIYGKEKISVELDRETHSIKREVKDSFQELEKVIITFNPDTNKIRSHIIEKNEKVSSHVVTLDPRVQLHPDTVIPDVVYLQELVDLGYFNTFPKSTRLFTYLRFLISYTQKLDFLKVLSEDLGIVETPEFYLENRREIINFIIEHGQHSYIDFRKLYDASMLLREHKIQYLEEDIGKLNSILHWLETGNRNLSFDNIKVDDEQIKLPVALFLFKYSFSKTPEVELTNFLKRLDMFLENFEKENHKAITLKFIEILNLKDAYILKKDVYYLDAIKYVENVLNYFDKMISKDNKKIVTSTILNLTPTRFSYYKNITSDSGYLDLYTGLGL